MGRKASRDLLTLEERDPRRLFEGNALLRRLGRIGVLDEGRMKLDYVLGLKIEDFLERRLQTSVQTGIGQVHPPRSRPHPPASHPCPQAAGEHPELPGAPRLAEAHRLRAALAVRWRPCRSRQEEEPQEGPGRLW